MDAIFSSEQGKASTSKRLTKDKNDSREENKERKLRFRHLTGEMLENIVGWVKNKNCFKGNTKKLLSKFMEHFLLGKLPFRSKYERNKNKKAKITNTIPSLVTSV